METREQVTAVLRQLNDGSGTAPDELLPLVYDELRKLAASYMANERPGHTLQATALVHDAYIRLVDWENVSWQNRAHFFSVAAKVMRNILVNHAISKRAAKNDFGTRIGLSDNLSLPGNSELDLFELNEALTSLSAINQRQAEIVELRFFGGLTIEETAHVLKSSPATIKREWTIAKTWLYRRLKSE